MATLKTIELCIEITNEKHTTITGFYYEVQGIKSAST
jgi:hypothetical protein